MVLTQEVTIQLKNSAFYNWYCYYQPGMGLRKGKHKSCQLGFHHLSDKVTVCARRKIIILWKMLTKVLQTLIAKFITLKAAIRPQNTGHKAAAAKRPHFAHGWLSPKPLKISHITSWLNRIGNKIRVALTIIICAIKTQQLCMPSFTHSQPFKNWVQLENFTRGKKASSCSKKASL